MATHKQAERSTFGSLAAALSRHVLIVVFTGVETLALAVWLTVVLDAPAASQATAIGLGILAIGLVVEHVLTDTAVNGLDAPIPGVPAIVFSLTETALWALWLVVAERIGGLDGVFVAGVLLAVLLVPQHTIEDNSLRGEGLLARLVNLNTVGFSIIEAAGATVWLALVLESGRVAQLLDGIGGLGVGSAILAPSTPDPALIGLAFLAVALFVEHNVGVSFSRRG